MQQIFDIIMPFEIPGYDSDSFKYFSKFGRNYSLTKKPSINTKPKQKKNGPNEPQYKRSRHILSTFDMTESREQRQKRNKPENTPAIGQYNPKYNQNTRPKFTWDILKVYHNKSKRKDLKMKIQSHQISLHTQQKQCTDEGRRQRYLITQQSYKLSQTPKKKKDKHKRDQLFKSKVNMVRMTGRSPTIKKLIYQDHQKSFEIDLSQSVNAVRQKTIQSVEFEKQLSRQKIESLDKKKSIAALDYIYDYKVVKPKSSIVPFKITKPRGDPSKRHIHTAYSYTHYDFDQYVWHGKSTVYPNTKTNVIDYTVERGRYK